MNYEQKYLKYKEKYLSLKNKIIVGGEESNDIVSLMIKSNELSKEMYKNEINYSEKNLYLAVIKLACEEYGININNGGVKIFEAVQKYIKNRPVAKEAVDIYNNKDAILDKIKPKLTEVKNKIKEKLKSADKNIINVDKELKKIPFRTFNFSKKKGTYDQQTFIEQNWDTTKIKKMEYKKFKNCYVVNINDKEFTLYYYEDILKDSDTEETKIRKIKNEINKIMQSEPYNVKISKDNKILSTELKNELDNLIKEKNDEFEKISNLIREFFRSNTTFRYDEILDSVNDDAIITSDFIKKYIIISYFIMKIDDYKTLMKIDREVIKYGSYRSQNNPTGRRDGDHGTMVSLIDKYFNPSFYQENEIYDFETTKNQISNLLNDILNINYLNFNYAKDRLNNLDEQIKGKDKIIRENIKEIPFNETEYESWYNNIIKQIDDEKNKILNIESTMNEINKIQEEIKTILKDSSNIYDDTNLNNSLNKLSSLDKNIQEKNNNILKIIESVPFVKKHYNTWFNNIMKPIDDIKNKIEENIEIKIDKVTTLTNEIAYLFDNIRKLENNKSSENLINNSLKNIKEKNENIQKIINTIPFNKNVKEMQDKSYNDMIKDINDKILLISNNQKKIDELTNEINIIKTEIESAEIININEDKYKTYDFVINSQEIMNKYKVIQEKINEIKKLDTKNDLNCFIWYSKIVVQIADKIQEVMKKIPYHRLRNDSCNKFDELIKIVIALYKEINMSGIPIDDKINQLNKYRENILNCKKN